MTLSNEVLERNGGGFQKPSKLKTVVLSLLALLLVLIFGLYIYANADKYLNLLDISIGSVALLLILSLLFPFINGLINYYMFQALGTELSIREGFILASVSTLANQLPISGGIISKGIYLKYKHGLSYTRFISATLALFFCFIAANGIIGVFTILFSSLFNRPIGSPLLLIGFSAMGASILILWLPLNHDWIPLQARKWINRLMEGWLLISKNYSLLFKLVSLQTLLMLLLAIRYWFAFQMLSQEITLGQCILFAAASVLTQLVSIAPGGLGVREAIVGGVAAALGFDIGVSVVAVGLDRLIFTIMIFIVGGISTILLGNEVSVLKPEGGKS